MRLPHWLPEVPRPWNPAYRSAWDAMTHSERQWSLLIDMAICAPAALIVLLRGDAGMQLLCVLVLLIIVKTGSHRS